jgi:protein-S-isoprenylcysteine O-methyltransferase Ste14
MVKAKHIIDPFKGVTFLVVLAMMAVYDQWHNPTAWVYLALHGTYGILWVLKSRTFGDRQWEQPASPGFALVLVIGLALYWVAPWILTSRNVEAPSWYLGVCISLYAFGLFLHFASDMQKHTALKLRPGLITDGLWSRTRNPNYFGELLIYLGFGLLAMHWLPLLVLGLIVAAYWIPNMRKKDRSLSRYPEFAAYRERTKLFIPFLF